MRKPEVLTTLLVLPSLFAWGAFAQSPTSSSAMTSAAAPAFEVAIVKVNSSGSTGSHTRFQVDGFIGTNVSLKSMIQYQAFNIAGPRIIGGPKWLDSARFDIDAKMDGSTMDQVRALGPVQGRAAMQAMFQQLLTDRFKLTTHWEERELPVYALVVAKGGPRLERTKDPGHSGTSAGTGFIQGKGLKLGEMAELITQEAAGELGRTVIDKTGIDGAYDMVLKWSPDNSAVPANGGAAGAGPGPSSIFTAIEEELGLKLESAKGPVRVLVIDHAEMPSDN